MKYIDIHTHKINQEAPKDQFLCYNLIIGQETGHPSDVEIYSAGIHPWFISPDKSNDILLGQLREKARQPQVRLIGEAGLDKSRNTSFKQQLDLFEQQILLAEELHKPLIIHCVKAWNELLALRKKIRPLSPWIIHGFRGKRALAEQLLKENIYLSFGEHFQPEAVQAAWPTHLFLETDESKLDIQKIYDKIAIAIAVPIEVLAKQIEANLLLLLGK